MGCRTSARTRQLLQNRFPVRARILTRALLTAVALFTGLAFQSPVVAETTAAPPAPLHSTVRDAAQSKSPSEIASMRSRGSTLPFYETWYFYLALLFLGMILPVQIFRRRMLLMKGRIGIVLEERNRISRECHDTLMAGFAAISWQLEATSKLFRDSGLASTPAAESCELARSMVAHCQAEARRIIWDLRESDEVTSILSHALARSLAANHVQGRAQTTLEVEGDEIPLAPGCVHHLVCIGQEAVSNAIRHGGPTRILVHVKYASDAVFLSIRDNGSGFPSHRSSSHQGHFGIAVMQERVRKLGGVFRIHPLPDSGTEVAVQVPFNAMRQPVSQEQNVIRWIGV